MTREALAEALQACWRTGMDLDDPDLAAAILGERGEFYPEGAPEDGLRAALLEIRDMEPLGPFVIPTDELSKAQDIARAALAAPPDTSQDAEPSASPRATPTATRQPEGGTDSPSPAAAPPSDSLDVERLRKPVPRGNWDIGWNAALDAVAAVVAPLHTDPEMAERCDGRCAGDECVCPEGGWQAEAERLGARLAAVVAPEDGLRAVEEAVKGKRIPVEYQGSTAFVRLSDVYAALAALRERKP